MSYLLPNISSKISSYEALLKKLESRKIQVDQTFFEKVVQKITQKSTPNSNHQIRSSRKYFTPLKQLEKYNKDMQ